MNTGAALDFVKNNVFTVSSGSRNQEDIPQILVLLSGRKSDDDVQDAGDTLAGNAGIVLHTIGLNNADKLEMEEKSCRNFFNQR